MRIVRKLIIISVFIILLNFPFLSNFMHQKPIYFDDLQDDSACDEQIRQRFQRIFVFLINIFLTL